jgi:hypothetical protein
MPFALLILKKLIEPSGRDVRLEKKVGFPNQEALTRTNGACCDVITFRICGCGIFYCK